MMSTVRVVLVPLVLVLTAWDTRMTQGLLVSGPTREDLKVVKIALIHRHGNRGAEATYPNDPYPPKSLAHWPDGQGQLTIQGKRRMLNFGRWLRKRFDGFLSDNPLESFVRSSPVERCINSAQLVMTGLYPPKGRLVIEEGLNWQPVAVNIPDSTQDRTLASPHKLSCVAGENAAADNVARLGSQYNASDYKDIIEGSGANITTPCDVFMIFDSLKAAQYSDKPLPAWVTPEVLTRMERISEVCWEIMTSGDVLPRLNGGVFLYDLQKFFASPDPVYFEKAPRKALFFASHDGRIVPLLHALGIHDGAISEYGVSLLFELLQSPEGQLFVRTFYIPDTLKLADTKLISEVSRGCPTDQDCTAEQFFAGLKDFIIDYETHTKECKGIA